MPDFVADLPAAQVHTRLQAALDNLQEAEQNAVLWFAEVVRHEALLNRVVRKRAPP